MGKAQLLSGIDFMLDYWRDRIADIEAFRESILNGDAKPVTNKQVNRAIAAYEAEVVAATPAFTEAKSKKKAGEYQKSPARLRPADSDIPSKINGKWTAVGLAREIDPNLTPGAMYARIRARGLQGEGKRVPHPLRDGLKICVYPHSMLKRIRVAQAGNHNLKAQAEDGARPVKKGRIRDVEAFRKKVAEAQKKYFAEMTPEQKAARLAGMAAGKAKKMQEQRRLAA